MQKPSLANGRWEQSGLCWGAAFRLEWRGRKLWGAFSVHAVNIHANVSKSLCHSSEPRGGRGGVGGHFPMSFGHAHIHSTHFLRTSLAWGLRVKRKTLGSVGAKEAYTQGSFVGTGERASR